MVRAGSQGSEITGPLSAYQGNRQEGGVFYVAPQSCAASMVPDYHPQ